MIGPGMFAMAVVVKLLVPLLLSPMVAGGLAFLISRAPWRGAAGGAHSAHWLTSASMILGGGFAGTRVTRTLAFDVVRLDHRAGLTANSAAAVLVAAGTLGGLPLSTTHVASGGILGAGSQSGTVSRMMLREIGLAWIVTLPAAALLGAGAFVLGGLVPST